MSARKSSAAQMGANASSAVRQQRKEPPDSLDYFPTPPWATRALCEWLREAGYLIPAMRCWEPACGEGHMARPLGEYFRRVFATDVHDYGGAQERVVDFLFGDARSPAIKAMALDWINTNPPFRLAEQFIATARGYAGGVAVLVRSAFLEGVARHESLFRNTPPTHVLQFVERVPMLKGRLSADASTATSYCWLVWIEDDHGTRFHWLAPCRKRLEREGDYPDAAPVDSGADDGLFAEVTP